MGPQVTAGATLMCPFGLAPATLVVLPVHRVLSATFAANITDMVPVANIPPFGACTSLANPMVAAATAAALGVLVPMPCVPVPTGPWLPGSTKVMLGGMPAVDATCSAICAWGGVIRILSPGQMVMIDG
jgi:hypothetical protein